MFSLNDGAICQSFMKTPIGIFFICAASLFAQTNQYYVTDVRVKNLNSFAPTAEQVESAKRSIESRPAEDDPEGNWGAVTDGFRLSIRLEKKLFTRDEPITASILLRNVSDKLLTYYEDTTKNSALQIIGGKDGQKFYRKDEAKPGMTFVEQLRRLKRGNQWSAMVEPGTQRKFVVDLTNVFDLSTNGEYKIQALQNIQTAAATSLTNVAEIKDAIARKVALSTNVISGTATFYITNTAVK
jgi:hypothetical protein